MEEPQGICPNCGHLNRTNARFCGKCGYDMHKIAATPKNDTSSSASTLSQSTAPSTVPGALAHRPQTSPAAVSETAKGGGPSAVLEPVAPERANGAPGWLWLLTGILAGILIGGGLVLRFPVAVGLERTTDLQRELPPTPEPVFATTEMTPAVQPVIDPATEVPSADAEPTLSDTAVPAPAEAATLSVEEIPPADSVILDEDLSTPSPADLETPSSSATQAASPPP